MVPQQKKLNNPVKEDASLSEREQETAVNRPVHTQTRLSRHNVHNVGLAPRDHFAQNGCDIIFF